MEKFQNNKAKIKICDKFAIPYMRRIEENEKSMKKTSIQFSD